MFVILIERVDGLDVMLYLFSPCPVPSVSFLSFNDLHYDQTKHKIFKVFCFLALFCCSQLWSLFLHDFYFTDGIICLPIYSIKKRIFHEFSFFFSSWLWQHIPIPFSGIVQWPIWTLMWNVYLSQYYKNDLKKRMVEDLLRTHKQECMYSKHIGLKNRLTVFLSLCFTEG